MKRPIANGDYELTCDPATGDVDIEVSDLPGAGPALAGCAVLGYRRRREKDAQNGEGEDDVWLYTDRNRVVAVLADGVSQSFYGQIAAQQLVGGLGRLLRTIDSFSSCAEQMIKDALRAMASEAAERVAAYPLRENLSAMMRELLEEERQKGSEAVFGAFVYDRSSRRLMVCQLGDVRIRVFAAEGQSISSRLVTAKKMGRFSTRYTAQSNDRLLSQNLLVAVYDDITGALIHSDGVDDAWGKRPAALEPDLRSELRETLGRWASSDDASFVGVLTDRVFEWAGSAELESGVAPAAASGERFEPGVERAAASGERFAPRTFVTDPASEHLYPVSGLATQAGHNPPGSPALQPARARTDSVPTVPAVGTGRVRASSGTGTSARASRRTVQIAVCALAVVSVSFAAGRVTAPRQPSEATDKPAAVAKPAEAAPLTIDRHREHVARLCVTLSKWFARQPRRSPAAQMGLQMTEILAYIGPPTKASGTPDTSAASDAQASKK